MRVDGQLDLRFANAQSLELVQCWVASSIDEVRVDAQLHLCSAGHLNLRHRADS